MRGRASSSKLGMDPVLPEDPTRHATTTVGYPSSPPLPSRLPFFLCHCRGKSEFPRPESLYRGHPILPATPLLGPLGLCFALPFSHRRSGRPSSPWGSLWGESAVETLETSGAFERPRGRHLRRGVPPLPPRSSTLPQHLSWCAPSTTHRAGTTASGGERTARGASRTRAACSGALGSSRRGEGWSPSRDGGKCSVEAPKGHRHRGWWRRLFQLFFLADLLLFCCRLIVSYDGESGDKCHKHRDLLRFPPGSLFHHGSSRGFYQRIASSRGERRGRGTVPPLSSCLHSIRGLTLPSPRRPGPRPRGTHSAPSSFLLLYLPPPSPPSSKVP